MVLFIPSGLITYLQPVLVGLRRQTHVDVASAGERLKAFLIMFLVLEKLYDDGARAVSDFVTLAGQKSRYLKSAFFKLIVIVTAFKKDARQIIRYHRLCKTVLRY